MRRTGHTFRDSKRIYDRLRTRSGRAPSLRMVAGATSAELRLPRAPKAGVERPAAAPAPTPSNIRPAPPLQRPTSAVVPAEQRGRNLFERMLAKAGLPVACARSTVGRELVKSWRTPDALQKIVNTLSQAYKQVQREGHVKDGTKNRLIQQVLKINLEWQRGAILQRLLAALYGKGGK